MSEASTPFLDGLADAADSAYWPRFYANGLPTVYSVMALHTGLLPHSGKAIASNFVRLRVDAFPGALRRHGYRTFYFTGSDPDWDNSRAWLRQWYDEIYYSRADDEEDRKVFRAGAERIVRWKRDARAPFLATFVSISNHVPFEVPEARFENPRATTAIDRLRASMGYTDDVVRELFETLRREPWFADTVFVVTGDHGFDLGDRGEAQGLDNLRHESTWVPLILSGLRQPLRGRQERVASHVDLAPTILEIAAVGGPTSGMGGSLLRPSPAKGAAVTVRNGNLAYETADHSLFLTARGEAMLYDGRDTLQERDVSRQRPDAVREAERLARAISAVADYAIERDRVLPAAAPDAAAASHP